VLALVALVANGTFDAERVVGEMRDGTVHHESAGEAAAHAERSTGDHGHEDPGADRDDHGPGHSHGTTGDHCTHQHGTPVPGSFNFALAFSVTTSTFTSDVVLTPSHIQTLLRPPSPG
jgi:hypothetical protein